METHNPQKILYRIIGILVFLGIGIFMYSKFQNSNQGPQITFISIHEYTTTESPFLTITGETQHTQKILINGRNVILDDTGSFEEIIVFPPGNTIIEIQLEDTFEKQRQYKYKINANYTLKKTEPIEIPSSEDNTIPEPPEPEQNIL